MTYISFTMKLVSIALAFLFNLEGFTVTAKMEINFPAGTLIAGSTTEYKVQLRMQGATPTAERLTQCTGFVLTTQLASPIYAVQFTGHAPSNIVHHLVLYGSTSRPTGDPCSLPLQTRYTLFVSTLNTPPIRFKTIDGSTGGMMIGGTTIGTHIQYVFLEVHYVSASTIPDTSTGVDVQYVLTAPSRYLSTLSIFAPGSIAPGQTQATVDGCTSSQITQIRIVGYQVHAHSHGRIVSLYRRTSTGSVSLIGNWNPQFPQAFFQRSALPLLSTDTLGIRCVYDSVGETQTIHTIGVPGQSGTEMCFVNLLFFRNVAPGPNPFRKATTCATNFIEASSLTPFPANTILSNHALYGNQTGTVVVDADHTVQLDLLTFT